MTWYRAQTQTRVQQVLQLFPPVEIRDLVREVTLVNLPYHLAYRVHGVHLYVEIPNAIALLASDEEESERVHRRYLRFLHLYQRMTHLVFSQTDAVKVDFQNQRLHFLLYKPYEDEALRVARAVAIAHRLLAVVTAANDLHAELADAGLCVGIESGPSLAVSNGTRGDREALYLGAPANQAAKLLGRQQGIFLGTEARRALGKSWEVADPTRASLSAVEVQHLNALAGLKLEEEQLLRHWKQELAQTPQSSFQFTRPTPPLKDLDLETLTPANARRLEAAVLMADLSGFTRYVADLSTLGQIPILVRVLHVIRKELRDVLQGFEGRKIRYLGDCLQGVLAKGERTTDAEATLTQAMLCAGALRGAMGVIHELLPESRALGLGIGLEYGPISLAALGVRGARSQCVVGRAVLSAETMQNHCNGQQTALGPKALEHASPSIRALFQTGPVQGNLDYNRIIAALEAGGERSTRERVLELSGGSITVPRAFAESL